MDQLWIKVEAGPPEDPDSQGLVQPRPPANCISATLLYCWLYYQLYCYFM